VGGIGIEKAAGGNGWEKATRFGVGIGEWLSFTVLISEKSVVYRINKSFCTQTGIRQGIDLAFREAENRRKRTSQSWLEFNLQG
jgi:hypothetical protein